MNLENPNLQQRLANDYVMGLMNSRARRNFEKRMQRNVELRALVQRTESIWHTLSLLVPEKQPPQKVWINISQRLFQEKPVHVAQLRKNLQSSSSPASANNTWLKTWAIAASIATFGLTTYIGLEMPPVSSERAQQFVENSQEQHLSVLINDQKQAGWLMKYDSQTQRIHIQTLQAEQLDTQRTYELWIIADGIEQPQSLGLMPEVGAYDLTLNNAQMALLNKVKKFAVSIEPAGGSPTGQPTSAPVYLGDVSKI